MDIDINSLLKGAIAEITNDQSVWTLWILCPLGDICYLPLSHLTLSPWFILSKLTLHTCFS